MPKRRKKSSTSKLFGVVEFIFIALLIAAFVWLVTNSDSLPNWSAWWGKTTCEDMNQNCTIKNSEEGYNTNCTGDYPDCECAFKGCELDYCVNDKVLRRYYCMEESCRFEDTNCERGGGGCEEDKCVEGSVSTSKQYNITKEFIGEFGVAQYTDWKAWCMKNSVMKYNDWRDNANEIGCWMHRPWNSKDYNTKEDFPHETKKVFCEDKLNATWTKNDFTGYYACYYVNDVWVDIPYSHELCGVDENVSQCSKWCPDGARCMTVENLVGELECACVLDKDTKNICSFFSLENCGQGVCINSLGNNVSCSINSSSGDRVCSCPAS